jgi:hypothetical protein
LASIRQQAFPQVAPEILLKECLSRRPLGFSRDNLQFNEPVWSQSIMQRTTAGYPPRGIAISGFGMEEDVQRSMEAGFEHHLIKPIDAQQLEALLTAQKN